MHWKFYSNLDLAQCEILSCRSHTRPWKVINYSKLFLRLNYLQAGWLQLERFRIISHVFFPTCNPIPIFMDLNCRQTCSLSWWSSGPIVCPLGQIGFNAVTNLSERPFELFIKLIWVLTGEHSLEVLSSAPIKTDLKLYFCTWQGTNLGLKHTLIVIILCYNRTIWSFVRYNSKLQISELDKMIVSDSFPPTRQIANANDAVFLLTAIL